MSIRLSVLDQTPVLSGYRTGDAIAATLELAQAADALGYTRYWCAEHHGLLALGNPCPEVLLARIGSITQRIRLGSGGVLLPYYSAFKVAEQFSMLEALFPNRIDLGIGRAPGGDPATARAVAGGRFVRTDFPQQMLDLLEAFYGENEADVVLQPRVDTRPQVWLLGSSDYSAKLSAQLGLRFAFAHFINPRGGDAVTREYRRDFVGREATAKPYSAAAVYVICADTDAEAAELEAAVDLRRVQRALNINAPAPTIEEARGRQYSERERQIIEHERARSLVGTPQRVCETLRKLQESYEADELIVLCVAGSYAARLRTYELLAEHFELGRTPAAPSDLPPSGS